VKGATMKLDDLRYKQKVAHFYRKHRKSSSEIMKAQARLLARDLAFQTQPYGKDQDVRKSAEQKVETEIRRVYKTAGEMGLGANLSYSIKNAYGRSSGLSQGNSSQNPEQAGRAFVSLVNSGKLKKAEELLKRVGVSVSEISKIPIGAMDAGQAHQSARYGPYKRVPRNQLPLRVVPSGKIKTYVNKIRKNVGIAKAGWAAGANILGGMRGIPQWVTRNIGRAQGGSVVDQSEQRYFPKITLINNVPWVSQILKKSDIERAVYSQHRKMLNALDKAIRAEAKAEGF